MSEDLTVLAVPIPKDFERVLLRTPEFFTFSGDNSDRTSWHRMDEYQAAELKAIREALDQIEGQNVIDV